ncbi:MAG: lysophospholipid acyltransferase family protein [Planctomycetota bacterium]
MSRSSSRRRWTRRLSNYLARVLGPTLFRCLAKTWRVRFLNPELRDALHEAGTPPVIGFWHQQIPAGIGSHRGYPVRVLVSLNRDGEMIADIARRLGFDTIRGSSSRGASEAVREMLKVAKGPEAIAFTPDGPRGPLHSVAPGVVFLAAASRRPLMAIGFAASRYWQAGSWDKMVIPKPFAKVIVAYDCALGIPDRAAAKEGDSQEQVRVGLKESLDRAEAMAQKALQE